MATFTRKHFIATAETLSLIADEATRNDRVQHWVATFRKSNPRFDVAKFVDYVYDCVEKGDKVSPKKKAA